tara:strand:+ start:20479 stop:21192 length:714 start_codon:yes stop_codon:yes gene_type:complete
MKNKENPLLSILFNLVLPVIILKNGDIWLDGIIDNSSFEIPSLVLLVALAFPTGYFIYDWAKTKRFNFISILGFINVLLTGLIGIIGSKYGLSKNWYILKEGLIPLLIGVFLIASSKTKSPMLNALLYNETIFNIQKINQRLKTSDEDEISKVLQLSTYYVASAFFISSILQFILGGIIITVDPGTPKFNDQVGTMTWVSYFVVLIPSFTMFGIGIYKIINGIKIITKLEINEILNK